MADYRRLISYIYEYEGKQKGKNVGFAKLEARNGQCRINVNVKRIYMGGNAIGAYLLGTGGRETFLGNVFVRGGNGNSVRMWTRRTWKEPEQVLIHISDSRSMT